MNTAARTALAFLLSAGLAGCRGSNAIEERVAAPSLATTGTPATASPELEPRAGRARWEPAWPSEVCPHVEIDAQSFEISVCGCSAEARCRLETSAGSMPPTLIVELDANQPIACRDCVVTTAECPVESIPDFALINGRVPMTPWMDSSGQRTRGCAVSQPGAIEAEFSAAASVALMTAGSIEADCSGIGAWHSTLIVDEMLDGKPVHRVGTVHRGDSPPFKSGKQFLAILKPLAKPRPRPADRGLCLGKRESVDADLVRLIPVDSPAQARELLALWRDGHG